MKNMIFFMILAFMLALLFYTSFLLYRHRIEKRFDALFSLYNNTKNIGENTEIVDQNEYRRKLHDEKELQEYSEETESKILVKSIVSKKGHQAEKLGISFALEVLDGNIFEGWDGEDIVRILTNCTNNAIEACQRICIGKKQIVLGIYNDRFEIINNKPLVQKNSKGFAGKTSKENYFEHGYGTSIIDAIAQKHGCIVDRKITCKKYKLIIHF